MELTDDNYMLYAVKHYWSIHYTTAEFQADLKRVIYIKRLLKKYKHHNILSERLILNHLILLFNVFEPTVEVNKLLFLKIDESCYSALKTFLVYLNRMSDVIHINNDRVIISSDIKIDLNIANILRQL